MVKPKPRASRRPASRSISRSAASLRPHANAADSPSHERMPLIHGQDITALQVELEAAGWSAERFAQLCNAVAWALTWGTGENSIPAFTERVNVADGGKDAEWSREFAVGVVPP